MGRAVRETLTIAQRFMGLPRSRVEEMLDLVSLTPSEASRPSATTRSECGSGSASPAPESPAETPIAVEVAALQLNPLRSLPRWPVENPMAVVEQPLTTDAPSRQFVGKGQGSRDLRRTTSGARMSERVGSADTRFRLDAGDWSGVKCNTPDLRPSSNARTHSIEPAVMTWPPRRQSNCPQNSGTRPRLTSDAGIPWPSDRVEQSRSGPRSTAVNNPTARASRS